MRPATPPMAIGMPASTAAPLLEDEDAALPLEEPVAEEPEDLEAEPDDPDEPLAAEPVAVAVAPDPEAALPEAPAPVVAAAAPPVAE